MLRAITTLALALLTLAAASCGETSAGGNDPASLVPASTGLYFEANVRPEGPLRDDALAAAGKLLDTSDPAGALRAIFDRTLKELSPGASWARDFAPWVGERAGVWVTGLERDEPSFAMIIASRSQAAARAALRRLDRADGKRSPRRSYAGVPYLVIEQGLVVGRLGDFVVIGRQEAFEQTVRERDHEHLAGVNRYQDAIDKLDDDRLGHYYVDTKPLIEAAARRGPREALEVKQLNSLFPFESLGPIAGAFSADGDSMAIDNVLTKVPDGPLRGLVGLWAGGGSGLIRELPGDAWGVFSAPRVGESAAALFSSFSDVLDGASVLTQIRRGTGFDVQRDLTTWVGDVGVFVRGTRVPDLEGAIVIETIDDAGAAAAFGKLVGVLRRETRRARQVRVSGAEAAVAGSVGGKQVVLARAKDRVVGAYGMAAAVDALRPESKLSDATIYTNAKDLVRDGMQPTLLLSFASVLRLIDQAGEPDAEFKKVRRYLDALDVVLASGRADGERVDFRVAAAIR